MSMVKFPKHDLFDHFHSTNLVQIDAQANTLLVATLLCEGQLTQQTSELCQRVGQGEGNYRGQRARSRLYFKALIG